MEGKQRRKKSNKESVVHIPLTAGLRIVIVFMSWLTVCLKPDTSRAFFSTLFLASITSGYEFAVLYFEYRKTVLSKVYGTGFSVALFMFIYWFLGFVGMITLDVNNMVFKMGPASPIPLDVSWPFYWLLIPAFSFPCLIAAEQIIKSIAVSSGKKPITG